MSEKIENKARQRRWLLTLSALAFAVFQLPRLSFAGQTGLPQSILSAAELTGAIVFLASLVAVSRLFGKGKLSKAALSVLNDELVQKNRSKAYAIGFFTTVFMAAGLQALGGWVPLQAKDALLLVLVAGVCSATLSFAVLEGQSE